MEGLGLFLGQHMCLNMAKNFPTSSKFVRGKGTKVCIRLRQTGGKTTYMSASFRGEINLKSVLQAVKASETRLLAKRGLSMARIETDVIQPQRSIFIY